jgi:ABC-type lipoprotein export system ATPase subunit
MVTHEDEIAAHAERVIRFLDGKIDSDVQSGRANTPTQLERQPVEAYT